MRRNGILVSILYWSATFTYSFGFRTFSVLYAFPGRFTFSVFQLRKQTGPSVPKLPEIQTEGHPVPHIFSHCLQRCIPSLKTRDHTRSQRQRGALKSLKIPFWFGKSQKWREPLCDTNPCCHQRLNPSLPSAPG